MSSRVRRPEIERLELSKGDFLIVKKYLTAGEYRQLMRDSTKPITVSPGANAADLAREAAKIELDILAGSFAMICAYLLDWSFQYPDGRPIVIANQPRNVLVAALDEIDADSYMEVQRAIEKHEAAVREEIAIEKKTQSLPIASISTLQSVG